MVCVNCRSKKIKNLMSLGNLSFSGKFPKSKKKNVPKGYINLVKCSHCNLVQLDRKFNPKFLYNYDYGYKSGINYTMKSHLKSITKKLLKITKPNKNDYVLDIASNDGTLLNSYDTKKKLVKVGIDPILNKFSENYKNIDFKIEKFFSRKEIYKAKIKKKFTIISACAVFYDVHDPNKFLKDIENIINKSKGIFYLEFQDLLSIIKFKLFDTICHEHLEYYSLDIVLKMIKKSNLKLIDVSKNKINGGSLGLLIAHKDSLYRVNTKKIKTFLDEEKKYKLKSSKTYKELFNQIIKLKINLKKKLLKFQNQKKVIHGYGASTKGNILLQFFELDNKLVSYIADRNIKKNNCYTPGTKIKIITEKISRNLKPDYYLVLPWHFKKEILKREINIRKKGTKFIFPLPKLNIA